MFLPLEEGDQALIDAAREVLKRNCRRGRHGVGAAVRCGSGRIYTGINVETIHGPCAETVAIGTALTNGERDIRAVVAVTKEDDEYPVLSPCGNCRQLLLDYAPEAVVILDNGGEVVKTQAKNLLPGPYRTFSDDA